MSARVNPLVVMDTVARGCALHADRCVGDTGLRWALACSNDYDVARAQVAELVAAGKRVTAAFRAIGRDRSAFLVPHALRVEAEESLLALDAALAPFTEPTE